MDNEAAAPSRSIAFSSDFASTAFHKSLDYRQPEPTSLYGPHSLILGTKKSVKQPYSIFGRKANSSILNLKDDPVSASAETYCHNGSTWGILDGIVYEVIQNYFEM
jgi:hypothetical protein